MSDSGPFIGGETLRVRMLMNLISMFMEQVGN